MSDKSYTKNQSSFVMSAVMAVGEGQMEQVQLCLQSLSFCGGAVPGPGCLEGIPPLNGPFHTVSCPPTCALWGRSEEQLFQGSTGLLLQSSHADQGGPI